MTTAPRPHLTLASAANYSDAPASRDEDDLLRHWLALTPAERRREFAGTAAVAERYEVSQRTVQLWISSGLISAVHRGGQYRVLLRSVEEYLCRKARPE